MTSLECLVAGANLLGESAVWDSARQVFYWIDGRAPALFRLDPSSGTTSEFTMPRITGSVGLRKSGGLLITLGTAFYGFDPDTETLTLIVNPEPDRPDNKLNDGRCDRQGRYWAGSTQDKPRREAVGALYRLGADRACARIVDGLLIPNSIGWSPDSRVMYLGDTLREHILAYDFDADDGVVRNPRLFVDMKGGRGRPDGSTVDADGCLWNAHYGGGKVIRYTPSGQVDRVVELPVTYPTSCAFGGPGLTRLFITTSRWRVSPADLVEEPLAGALFAIDVGVAGLPEPAFAG